MRFFQYRNKNGPRRKVYDTALRLSRSLKQTGLLFIVNDHADIAAAVDADGVHLGQEDLPIEQARQILGPDRLIGISTHSMAQATEAWTAGADYIGFGPVFPTATKNAGAAQGLENLRHIRQAVPIPIFAIGGITRETVRDVLRAGADGAAVISAVLGAPDPGAEAKRMMEAIRNTEGS